MSRADVVADGPQNGPWHSPGTNLSVKGPSDWAKELGDTIEGQSYAPFVATPLLQGKRLVDLAGIVAADVVCDLGCGEASLLREVVRLTGCTAVGCDVDADALARGQAHIDAGPHAASITLTHAQISAFMLRPAFQRVTCVVVFLVPQQLEVLEPNFRSFLAGTAQRRILSERFAIAGLHAKAQIEGCAAVPPPAPDGVDHGRSTYFGALGPAFLYGG